MDLKVKTLSGSSGKFWAVAKRPKLKWIIEINLINEPELIHGIQDPTEIDEFPVQNSWFLFGFGHKRIVQEGLRARVLTLT